MFNPTMGTVFSFNAVGEIISIRYIPIDVFDEFDNQQAICC